MANTTEMVTVGTNAGSVPVPRESSNHVSKRVTTAAGLNWNRKEIAAGTGTDMTRKTVSKRTENVEKTATQASDAKTAFI